MEEGPDGGTDKGGKARKEYTPEGQKLFYDTFKHITTLSTGSILITTTFLTRFPEKPESAYLVGVSLLGFLVSIVGAVVTMITFAEAVHRGGNASEGTARGGQVAATISWSSFIAGLLLLGAFVWKNLH